MRIGLIGVGLLGSAVAERLIGAGHDLSVYDLNPDRLRQVANLGAKPVPSAQEAGAGSETVVTCLPDGPAVLALAREPGFLAALSPGCVWIDLTTCAPAEARLLSASGSRSGAFVLDAPISGSSAAVRRGEGLLMVGGEERIFVSAKPLLEEIAARVRYLGPSGSGSTAKLVSNLVLGLNRLALAEGLALAEAAGLEPAAALAVLQESAAYSRAMDAKGARMTEHRYDEPEARLRQHLKDVDLILALGRETEQELPVSSLHAELLRQAVGQGLGDADNAAVIEALRGRARPVPAEEG